MTNYTFLQDLQVKYPIYDLNLTFNDYISRCHAIVQNNRADLKQYTNPSHVIAVNTPFELKPQQSNPTSGALLIHGLLDSPFVMRDIAAQLQAQGMLTRAILLPGHGTIPGSLLNVTYEDWLQAIRYGIASLAKEVEKIYLIGYSTGASLALLHVLQNPQDNIAGIVSIAPAIKINSKLDFIQGWLTHLPKCWQRTKWLRISEENDYAKYESIPFNAGYQVYRLAQALQNTSKKIVLRQPMLTVLAQDDGTVCSTATLRYLQKYASKSKIILYTNKDNTNKNPNIITRPANVTQWNIANSSHIALPIAADNSHYGINGDYIYASHVLKNLNEGSQYIYGTRDNFQNRFANLLKKIGLKKQLQMRLTFNPDFEFLQQTITAFVKNPSSFYSRDAE